MNVPDQPAETISWPIALQRFQLGKWGMGHLDWGVIDTPVERLSKLRDLSYDQHNSWPEEALRLAVAWRVIRPSKTETLSAEQLFDAWSVHERREEYFTHVREWLAEELDHRVRRLAETEGEEFVRAFSNGTLTAVMANGREVEPERWLQARVALDVGGLKLTGVYDPETMFVNKQAFAIWMSQYPKFDAQGPSAPSQQAAQKLLLGLMQLGAIDPEEADKMLTTWSGTALQVDESHQAGRLQLIAQAVEQIWGADGPPSGLSLDDRWRQIDPVVRKMRGLTTKVNGVSKRTVSRFFGGK